MRQNLLACFRERSPYLLHSRSFTIPFNKIKPYLGFSSKSLTAIKNCTFSSSPSTDYPAPSVVTINVIDTPNEHCLKFALNRGLVDPDLGTVEFINAQDARGKSLLAERLFSKPETRSVFFGSDFIIVCKDTRAVWDASLRNDYTQLIKNFFSLINQDVHILSPPFKDELILKNTASGIDKNINVGETQEEDSENVDMIKEIIATHIRPSIQDDGGDIEFVSFESGILKISLKGSCRSCELSEVTLKDGVERMLKYYVSGIIAVENVERGNDINIEPPQ